jgi:predicted negative regulator of RcsB-dependent stress response
MDNSTPEMDETLVRLLDGALSPEERMTVEQQLAGNALLQQQYDSLLATKAAIRHFGLQQQVGAIHSQMMAELNAPVRKISPVRKMIRYTSAIAAGILLLAAGFFAYQYFSLTPEKVFSANYQAYELNTSRGSTTTSSIEEAYRQKKFEQVIQLRDAGTEPGIKNDFLAGAAALELNNLSLAKQRFTGVIEQNKTANTSVLNDEAEYYLALTQIRQKDFAAAILVLEKIQNDTGHTYYAKVKNGLLNDVRKLLDR